MHRIKVFGRFIIFIGLSCVLYLGFSAKQKVPLSEERSVKSQDHAIADSEKNMNSSSRPQINGDFIVERRTFPNHKECRNFTTRVYEEGTFNKTALISYPGSGNTWMRHLIEMATGVFTGSVYFDETLLARGFLGEREDWSSGSTIVQKLHLNYNKAFEFQRGILIIREPIAASRSFVQYLESGHHTGWASPTTFLRKEWPIYVLQSTYNWITLAKTWLESSTELLVIHYEDLKESPKLQITKVCQFLRLDCSRMDSKCFQMNIEGSFHRKNPLWKITTRLPPEIQEKVDDGIDYLNELLVAHGKDPIPYSKYSYYRNKNFVSSKSIQNYKHA